MVGIANARRDPVIREAALTLPHWPDHEPPVQVLVMSDIHLGSMAMDLARLKRIVRIANSKRPDLIFLAGDFVNGRDKEETRKKLPALSSELGRLKARLGVIAVLGNHDHYTEPALISQALRKVGIDVLENRAIQRGPLAIGGLDDPATGHDAIGKMLKSLDAQTGARVVIAHSPKPVWRLPKDGTLLLAGHTHCGQIRIPVLWSVLAKHPDFRCGLVQDRRRTTVITGGLGTTYMPIRYGSPPDVWLLRLGPA